MTRDELTAALVSLVHEYTVRRDDRVPYFSDELVSDLGDLVDKYTAELRSDVEYLQDEIEYLADYITENVPGEPSRSEGAVDTAIRLLEEVYGGRG